MESIKVFYNGKRLRDVYPHATSWQVFKWKAKKLLRKAFVLSLVSLATWIVFQLGGWLNPATIVTRAEVIREVETTPPVLDRIIKCESGGQHFDKNGQVLMRSNTNKSVDLGVAQINTVWFSKASELGYDLTKEADNRAMALWIIRNFGSSPWSATYNCWK